MPGPYKFGVFLKKAVFEKAAVNQKSGESVVALRTKIVVGSINLIQCSEEAVQLLMFKLLDHAKCPRYQI